MCTSGDEKVNVALHPACSTAADDSPVTREGLRRAALESMKRLVERHLDSTELSADFICARSGWSRATVYRLFEAEGGLARYIRRRRLAHAFRELMSGQQCHKRILDLALAYQFSSEATFNRAFRRVFGMPPGKARDLAALASRTPADVLAKQGHWSDALEKYDEALKYAPNWAALKQARDAAAAQNRS